MYAVEWGEDYIDYFVDNYLFQRITPETVTETGYTIRPSSCRTLRLAETSSASPQRAQFFPQSMYVDYKSV